MQIATLDQSQRWLPPVRKAVQICNPHLLLFVVIFLTVVIYAVRTHGWSSDNMAVLRAVARGTPGQAKPALENFEPALKSSESPVPDKGVLQKVR